MIGEFEFFHGAVIARMLRATQQAILVTPYSESDNAAYVINGDRASTSSTAPNGFRLGAFRSTSGTTKRSSR